MLKTKQKIRLARMVQVVVMGVRRLLARGVSTRVRRGGIHWELDLEEGIDFSIWLLGAFEPETVRCYQGIVRPGDTVLDIGANIGAHTLPLAQAVGPSGKVFAFEPTDYAFAKLSRNAALNPALASRILGLQMMLGDANSEGSRPPMLYSSWPLKDDEDLHRLHQGRLKTTTGASVRTLDSALAAINLTRLDCVKVDIDGAECAMLRGARTVLTRWQPVIIMELSPYVLEEQKASLGELLHLLKDYGYALHEASSDKVLEMDEAKLNAVIPPGASVNVVARPRTRPAALFRPEAP